MVDGKKRIKRDLRVRSHVTVSHLVTLNCYFWVVRPYWEFPVDSSFFTCFIVMASQGLNHQY